MQKKASIAQRLVQETGFREAACTAFSYAGRNQSSDLLQRCKALNACIQQGFVPQPVQIEDSASDSDICSECSTSDSDIPDIEVGRSPQAVVSCAKGGAGAAVALRRPTLVQQAAAATIQQHYRRYGHRKLISKSQGVLHNGHSAKSPVKAPVTAVAQAEAQAQHKHQAANCIQACWRQHVVRKALMAAPLTPPCSNSHMQSSCSSLHSSRPGSALSIGTSGLQEQFLPSSASLAKLRVSSAAAVRRKKAPMPVLSHPAAKAAAMLVVQRTSVRAQQVQAMEQQKWLSAQTGS